MITYMQRRQYVVYVTGGSSRPPRLGKWLGYGYVFGDGNGNGCDSGYGFSWNGDGYSRSTCAAGLTIVPWTKNSS